MSNASLRSTGGSVVGDEDDPDDDFAAAFKKQGSSTSNPNQACVREGILKKKSPAGMIRKVWQSRYFKLMPDCMVYSKKKEDKEPQGVIPLTSIGQVTIPKGKGAGRFDVEVVGAGVRTFCLQAKDDKEALQWVETLKNLQKNATRGSHSPLPKPEAKDLAKGAKSPNGAGGNKFWKSTKALARESRIPLTELDGEPRPDSEAASIKLHVQSQDSGFVGFGDLYFAHDRRHRGSSYMLHAINKKDKVLGSARLLFKDMKEINNRFIFNQVHTGETSDTVFAMYEPACEKDSSLAHHLRTVKKFPEDVVLTIAAQLTLALEYIHDSLGSGFWTLSPNKLWFGSDGSLSIKEPLLCLPASEIPKEMMIASYRSPEHFQEGEAAIADWWRLGLLMYELLTGTNPFVKAGSNPEALIPKFKVSELKFSEDVSKSTQDLIRQLMDPNPAARLGHENDGVDVRGCASWGPSISKSWESLGTRTPPCPWLKTHILDPAEAKLKHKDNRPAVDKSESVVEVALIGSRGVVLEETDTGLDLTQKKTLKKEKKLPPKLMCKLDFEGQYFSTAAVSAVKSQLDWNEKFTFKFRGPVHPTFNIVIQVVDQSKGYGLIVGDITIRLVEIKTFGASPAWYSILTPDATANGEVQLSVTMSKSEEKAGSTVSHLPKPLSHYFGNELAGAAATATSDGEEADESARYKENKGDDDDDADGSVGKDDTTAMRDAAGNLVHYLHKIRDKRGKDPPKRFKNDKHDLDLTYITPKIIAMSDPTESSKVGNTPEAILAFFKQYHSDSYKLYNLGTSKIPPEKLAASGGKLYDCPVTEHNVPSFQTLIHLVHDAEAHFNSKDGAVVAVNCSTGKGRAGMVIACFLLVTGIAETADEALFIFAKKRTPDAIAVTDPSQRRYVHYFEKYLKDYHKLSKPFPTDGTPVTLLRIRLTPLYSLDVGGTCDPYFVCLGPAPRNEVLYDHKKATKGNLAEFKSDSSHADLVCIDESDNSPTGCILYGDIKFVFFDHAKNQHMTADTKLFHFWLNPAFTSNEYVSLDRVQIDGAQNKIFKSSFRVELFFAGT